MRIIIILVISTFIVQPSFGRCGSALVVYPEGMELDLNEKIIMEGLGFGEYYEIFRKLDSIYPIYIQSGEHKIKLIKEDVIRGQFRWSQAIFRLDDKLIEGRVYELKVQNLSLKDHKFLNLTKRYSDGKFGKIKWLATQSSTPKPSLDLSKIIVHESKVIQYGCGPSVQTTFNLPSTKNYPDFILTEILEENTGKTFKFHLSQSENLITVGHDMCSGPYKFKNENSYKIRFGTTNKKNEVEWKEWMNCPNPWNNEND